MTHIPKLTPKLFDRLTDEQKSSINDNIERTLIQKFRVYAKLNEAEIEASNELRVSLAIIQRVTSTKKFKNKRDQVSM